MNIAFRVDASQVIGSGHVMRCLTLAEALRKHHCVTFICSNLDGNLIEYIQLQQFEVYIIPKMYITSNTNESFKEYDWIVDAEYTQAILQANTIDCLITDHYLIDKRWELKVKPFIEYLVVIDDLANRPHKCDILIDQNYYCNKNNLYKELVCEETKLLLGENYALLRDEFMLNKKSVVKTIETIFVYFGASDLSNETGKLLEAFISKNFKFKLNVLIGHSNPHKNELLEKYEKNQQIDLVFSTNKISGIMMESDIAIGAGGSTTWERCCIGIPSIVVIVAENQKEPMKELEKAGAIKILDESSVVNYTKLLTLIKSGPIEVWQALQKNGWSLYDGLGKNRIKVAIEEMNKNECGRTL